MHSFSVVGLSCMAKRPYINNFWVGQGGAMADQSRIPTASMQGLDQHLGLPIGVVLPREPLQCYIRL